MIEAIDRPISREEALRRLRALEPELRARGVESLFLFGSVGRDEATSSSDIDLFFDKRPGFKLSVFDLIGFGRYLTDTFGRKVDLTLRGGLHPLIREDVEREAVKVL
jgi:predicted nucleotidyltransferase